MYNPSFLTRYVFLIEQMHRGVAQVFSLQNTAAPLPSPLDESSLIHFAKEAELNQNYELAARYYQVFNSIRNFSGARKINSPF